MSKRSKRSRKAGRNTERNTGRNPEHSAGRNPGRNTEQHRAVATPAASVPLASGSASPAAFAHQLHTFVRRPEVIVAGFGLLCLALISRLLIDLTGHDYALFLPRMLDSHLFYLKNGLAIQDYTASFCAGIFNFANPNSLSISLSQAIAYLFGPVFAMQAAFTLSAMLAGVGLYFCGRYWGLDTMPACMAAIAVSFNGFMLVHIVVGHASYYGYGFMPAIAACLLYGAEAVRQGQALRAAVLGSLAALLLAAVVYTVGIILLHILTSIMLILLICGGFHRNWIKAGLFYLVCLAAAVLLSAPKIEAALAMNENVSRGFYPLPGFSFLGLPVVLSQGLFWFPAEATMNEHFRNYQFYLPWHETYYGFTPVVLLLGVAGLYVGRKKLAFRAFWLRRPVVAVLVAIMLVLPYAVNLYEPNWNQFLKSLPVIGQFSGLIRFFIVYIPVLALVLGWSWNHWKNIPLIAPLALIAVLAIVQFQAIKINTATAMYNDPEPILNAWASGAEQIPPISALEIQVRTEADGSNIAVHAPANDHVFVEGRSNALCYESLFGYRGERYPFGPLRFGDITAVDANGNLNLKNPACYVYPEENMCEPGDHFKQDQVAEMIALVNYEQPDLAISNERRIANFASASTLLVMLGIVFLQLGLWVYRLLPRRQNAAANDASVAPTAKRNSE
ncbi:MAG: hypothetical protein ACR2PR_08285 [Pseudohongiellaceae bacterium]